MPPATDDRIKSAANSFEIRGKKLGIVGYDSISTQIPPCTGLGLNALQLLSQPLLLQMIFRSENSSARELMPTP